MKAPRIVPRFPFLPISLMIGCLFAAFGCGGEGGGTTEPKVGAGSIEVSVVTTNNLDPDGFTVTVGGLGDTSVEPNGSVTIPGVPTGAWILTLGGMHPLCSLDDSSPKNVTVLDGRTIPVVFRVTCLSPPEGRILFSESFNGGSWISVMNADGSGKAQLIQRDSWSRTGGRWSPDGRKIAFSAFSQAGNNLDVYLMNSDASGVTKLTAGAEDEGYPAWSPDGTRIVFQVGGIFPGTQIGVIDVGGTNSARLTDHPTQASMWPSWSPDGAAIAFARFTQPQSLESENRIFVMQADGSFPTGLTESAPICGSTGFRSWSDFEPVWSPDGTKVLFLREGHCPELGEDLRLMLVSSSGEDVQDLGPATSADWSPDGSQIVYVLEHIYVMNPDGTGRVMVLASGGAGMGTNYRAVCWGG